MKLSKRCFVALAAAGLLIAACNKEETTYAPILEVTPTSIVAAADEGSYNFTYSVSNPAHKGDVTASVSASWIKDLTDTGSGFGFTVSDNKGSMRTAGITVTYTSSYGTSTETVTVAQNAGVAPSLTVQPVAVVADIEGGTYSFSYTITDPAADGDFSCGTSADWITDFDYNVPGEVSFTVAANETIATRNADIIVYYDSSYGTLEETVTVVQTHGLGNESGGGYDVDISDIVGTYSATGYAFDGDNGATEQTWTLKIYEYTYNDDTYALIDGLTPLCEGKYPETEAYVALGYLKNGALVIPTQLTGYYDTEVYYFIGWTPCVLFTEGVGWSYSYYWPDCTFTFTESDGTWTSDYGEFLGLFDVDSSYTNITGFEGFYDVTNPGVVITKTDSADSASAAPSAYIDRLARQAAFNASGMVFHPINEGLILHTDFICK